MNNNENNAYQCKCKLFKFYLLPRIIILRFYLGIKIIINYELLFKALEWLNLLNDMKTYLYIWEN